MQTKANDIVTLGPRKTRKARKNSKSVSRKGAEKGNNRNHLFSPGNRHLVRLCLCGSVAIQVSLKSDTMYHNR